LRLPALSLLPGQMPTHEASRSALPNAAMSAPIWGDRPFPAD
jgi:hypothetical protein